jgi:hypothetical protein
MAITTSTPVVAFPTVDGWTVTLHRYLVHVTAVSVAGADQVVAASATPQIIDQIAPGPKSLLSATVRTARHWEQVGLQIGPARSGSIDFADPVTIADRDMMSTQGYSLFVEGTATKANVTKTLIWGFTTDTLLKDCAGELNGTFIRGLVVPKDGSDSADVVMDGSVLFGDDLDRSRAVPRFDAIAAADADNDGVVTVPELHATAIDAAAASGGVYGLGGMDEVTELGAFIEELARRTVTSFRARGACTAEPTPSN